MTQLEWVKPPRQARSQQTLERLLDATEAIIDGEGIESATVAEIARRAGSSVGAFYSRFSDKEALVRCVIERFCEQAIATAKAALATERWEKVATREALATMVLFMLRILEDRRGVIVAMLMRAAKDPSVSALGDRLHDTIVEYMHKLIEERGHTISHADPVTAIRVAVWMVLSAMEARVVYGAHEKDDCLSHETIATEVAHMIIAYIGIDQEENAWESQASAKPKSDTTCSTSSATPRRPSG